MAIMKTPVIPEKRSSWCERKKDADKYQELQKSGLRNLFEER